MTNKKLLRSKKGLLFTFMWVFSLCIMAQSITIEGNVMDLNKEPLPGVTVVIKGTSKGVITDMDGSFIITDAPRNSTLQFSFVGMRTQEVSVAGKTKFNILMLEESTGLDELVVVGYGTTAKKNLTGAVSTIDTKQLTIAPVASTANALAGHLPGLIAKQESGLPGRDGASLSIRGFGSPLVIVDGVESSFNNIDANEIESISILKDASAAIYGSRAGNGVMLVTTKRGLVNKPTITLNSTMTYQGNILPMKLQSAGQYAELERERHIQSGQPEDSAPWTAEEVQLFYDGTNPDYANTDWLKELTQKWAPQQQHNLSIRGGSEKVRFYTFIGFLDQEAMFKSNGGKYKRYNFRNNLDFEILDNLSAKINFAAIVDDRSFPNRPYEFGNSIWNDLWGARPYYAAHLPDPSKLAFSGGSGINAFTNRELSGYQDNYNQRLDVGGELNYSFLPVKGLSAKAFFNYNQNHGSYKAYQRPFETWLYFYSSDTYVQQGGNQLSNLRQVESRSRTITGQLSLNYDRTFNDDHYVSALALYEFTDIASSQIEASRSDFISPGIDYLFGGSESGQLNNGSAAEMGRASYIGRLNYSYKGKYLIESSIRYDASAKFPSDKRWGVFPSVSVGWRLSEEDFVKDNLDLFDDFKIRMSYSQMGNDGVGDFQYLSGYTFPASSTYINYAIGDGTKKALLTKGLANPFLTWEDMNIKNLGVDISLWNRKLYGQFDMFYRERNGIPATRLGSTPSTFGAVYPPENLNSLNNRGFEAMIGHASNFSDFRWDVSANVSWTRSKWNHFEEPEYLDPDEERIYRKSGQWTDRNFGYKSDGLFTSMEEIENLDFDQDKNGNSTLRPGDVKFIDTNGDNILDWRDMVEIGRGTTPHWMIGLRSSFAYKNFDCSLLFQGALDFYNQVNVYGSLEILYTERWSEENNVSDALFPRLGGSSTNNLFSDFTLRRADYLRLKTVSIGYTIPKAITERVKLSNLRIYFAGMNLFTFDGLKRFGVDPEAPSNSSTMYYPQQRTLTFGLNLSF